MTSSAFDANMHAAALIEPGQMGGLPMDLFTSLLDRWISSDHNTHTATHALKHTHCNTRTATHALQHTHCNTRTATHALQHTHCSTHCPWTSVLNYCAGRTLPSLSLSLSLSLPLALFRPLLFSLPLSLCVSLSVSYIDYAPVNFATG